MPAGIKEIGIVNYPRTQLAAVHGLTDLFLIANRIASRQSVCARPLRISQWSLDRTSSAPARTLDTGEGQENLPAVLIMPPSFEPLTRQEAVPFIPWLRHCHHKGTVLGSVCGGAYLLAETGLLAGRSVTTHWEHAEAFRTRFPSSVLELDRLIIDDGDVITAGGMMSWIDLGLKLVDRFLGRVVMVDTARFLLVDPPGREQRYYSAFSPNFNHADAAIRKVQHWLQATGAKDTTLDLLASRAGLEERTFIRRFRKATGLTAIEYCQRLRVGKAQELLQVGTTCVEAIASDVGYTDVGAFRRVFAKVTGLTPGEYRRRFSIGAVDANEIFTGHAAE